MVFLGVVLVEAILGGSLGASALGLVLGASALGLASFPAFSRASLPFLTWLVSEALPTVFCAF